jgi:hypothetical protein
MLLVNAQVLLNVDVFPNHSSVTFWKWMDWIVEGNGGFSMNIDLRAPKNEDSE